MRRITIALPEDLADLVEHEARQRGVSGFRADPATRSRNLMSIASSPRKIPWAGMDDPGMVRDDHVEEELARSRFDEPYRDR